MTFQNNLIHLRTEAGFKTAKEFSSFVDIPYPTYAGYENKGREPKYEVLCKIADALHVSTDELLGYEFNKLSAIQSLLIDCGYIIKDLGDSIEVNGADIKKDKLISLYDHIQGKARQKAGEIKRELLKTLLQPSLKYLSLLKQYESILALMVLVKKHLSETQYDEIRKAALNTITNLLDMEYSLREKDILKKDFPSLFEGEQFDIMLKQIEKSRTPEGAANNE